jgi:hypothetical protein
VCPLVARDRGDDDEIGLVGERRSSSTLIEKRRLLGTAPGSGATTRKSKFGMPSSTDRARTPRRPDRTRTGAKPGWTTQAMVFMAGILLL